MSEAYLVDASLYVFRAYHSVDPTMQNRDGEATHAVYGFTGFLLSLLEQRKPGHCLVAFDESLTSSFRNEIYPAYKANREPAPEDLIRQFGWCREVAQTLGLAVVSDTRYEADDLIGAASVLARRAGLRNVIVSADKDLSQLIAGDDEQWDFARQQRWGVEGVREKFGVYPHQIADYLALTGDSVDNIPGVPGIGPKAASALLSHFGELEALLRRVEEVPFLSSLRGARSLAEKLRAHGDAARMYRRLTAIACEDAPCPDSAEALRPASIRIDAADELFDRLGFGPLTRSRAKAWAQRTR